MLSYDDALNLNYYKKTTFTGWMQNMRFKIAKEKNEQAEDIFHAWVWQGPYIFSLAPKESFIEHIEPFDEAGRKAIVDWINSEFEKHPNFKEKKICR
ncbi:hypothetical protein [Lachnobacterium bovis]|uniref:hypothetical protein n=1 Tax=Lachnobacterium bovis TaxID=140626 RepID=UPI00068F5433|nr:hypothetical protein [Lachnobacterium bovis]